MTGFVPRLVSARSGGGVEDECFSSFSSRAERRVVRARQWRSKIIIIIIKKEPSAASPAERLIRFVKYVNNQMINK